MHSQNGYHHHLSSQAESMSCFYGGREEGVPSLASMSEPSFFQIAFSALELRAGEILHTPFKTGIHYGLKIQIWGGGSSFQCKVPRVETPDVGLQSFSPYGEPLQLWLHSHLWVACLKESMDLDSTISIPPSLWFLYIFSCGRSFLLV